LNNMVRKFFIIFILLVACTCFAFVVGSSSSTYSQNNLVVRSSANDYFNFNLQYSYTLRVETPDQYRVNSNTVCPNAPLTLTASINMPSYSVNSCEVSLDDAKEINGGSNGIISISSMNMNDKTTLDNEYFDGNPEAFNGGTDTSSTYRPYAPVTDSNSYSRTCKVEYSLNNFRNSQRVGVYTVVIPQVAFYYNGNLINTQTASSPGQTANVSYSTSASGSGSTVIRINTSPQYFYLVAYMPTTTQNEYSYNIFTQQALSTPFSTSSTSLTFNIRNKQLSGSVISVNPDNLPSIPYVIEVVINNTGDVPFNITNVAASNGYTAVIISNPGQIDPGNQTTVRVNITSAGSGNFNLNFTLSTNERDCSGNSIANINITTPTIQPPPYDLIVNVYNETKGQVNNGYSLTLSQDKEHNFTANVTFNNMPANSQANLTIIINKTTQNSQDVITSTYIVNNTPGQNSVNFSLSCNEFAFYNVSVIVDPSNAIQESNEGNNAVRFTAVCNANLACYINGIAQTATIIMLPKQRKSIPIYCGYDFFGNNKILCNITDINDMIMNPDPDFVNIGSLTKIRYQLQTGSTAGINATLYDSNTLSNNGITENQNKTFEINITIKNQQINLPSRSGTKVNYECKLYINAVNNPCIYYI
jgi:hypothetical protein